MDSFRSFSLKAKKKKNDLAGMSSENSSTQSKNSPPRNSPPKSTPSTPGTLINSPFDPSSPTPAGAAPNSSYFSSLRAPPPPSALPFNPRPAANQASDVPSTPTQPTPSPVTQSQQPPSVAGPSRATTALAISSPIQEESPAEVSEHLPVSESSAAQPIILASTTSSLVRGKAPAIDISQPTIKKISDASERQPTENMSSAIAAIINPLNTTGTRKVLLYSAGDEGAPADGDKSSKTFDVKLEQRYFSHHNTSYLMGSLGYGNLGNPSHLVAFTVDDMVHVFGVSNKKELDMISPAVRTGLANGFDEYGSLAGCSNGKDEGWLYKIRHDGVNNVKVIDEYVVSGGGQIYSSQLSARFVYEGTKLAAFYDGKQRWVVFQRSSSYSIAIRNCSTEEEYTVTRSPSPAPEKTQIAATFVKGANGQKDRIYVYWVSAEKKLLRSYAETGGNLYFSTPVEVEENRGTIAGWSQMSVITDTESRTNILYVRKETATGIIAVVDKWDSAPEHPKDCPGYPPPQIPAGYPYPIPSCVPGQNPYPGYSQGYPVGQPQFGQPGGGQIGSQFGEYVILPVMGGRQDGHYGFTQPWRPAPPQADSGCHCK